MVRRFVGLIWWVSGSVLVGLGCLYRRCLDDGDDESRWCYWWVSGMVVVDGLLRSGRGNGVTVEVFLFLFFWLGLDCWWIVGLLGLIVGAMVLWVFFFFFATMVCGCGLWWFKLRPQDWWLVLSFEAPVMAVVMVACVELWSSDHGGCGFDSKMERSGEERIEREGERLKA